MKNTQDISHERNEAKLYYESGSYKVIAPGSYVICAQTGSVILIEDLKYWSSEYQEAYLDADAASKAWNNRKKS